MSTFALLGLGCSAVILAGTIAKKWKIVLLGIVASFFVAFALPADQHAQYEQDIFGSHGLIELGALALIFVFAIKERQALAFVYSLVGLVLVGGYLLSAPPTW